MTHAVVLEPRPLLAGFAFPECPRWREDRLWFVDMFGRRVMTGTLDGATAVVAEFRDQPAGIGFLPDGCPAVVRMGAQLVVRLDAGRTTLADLASFGGDWCNDMVVADDGRAYVDCLRHRERGDVSDVGDCIIMIEPDGRPSVAMEGVVSPNGLALTADRRALIVAETRARRLRRFPIGADGSLGDGSTLAAGDEIEADGICLDGAGGVWFGSPYQAQFVRVEEGGRITHRVPVHGRWAVACTLGGPGRRTLFLAGAKVPPEPDVRNLRHSTGFIHVCEVEIPGAGVP
jgi:sugar lactone lactonase YvrE